MSGVQAVVINCLPCCNSNAVAYLLQCRARGGTASLIGCAEMASPSTPPKYYRRAEQSGSEYNDYYGLSSCSGSIVDFIQCVYSGFIQYDKTTGSPSTGGATTCFSTASPSGNVVSTGASCISGCPANPCNDFWLCTPTTAVRQSNGACCPGGPNSFRTRVGSSPLTQTLSDEDTEADAINRLIASVVYSGYGASCHANYQQRTNTNTFAYNEAQWRVNVSAGLMNNSPYTLSLQAWRAPYPPGSYGLYAYINTTFTTDATGAASITGQVPNFEGYETFVNNAIIFGP